MLYNVGDVLVCQEAVNTQCLEMSNPCFEIKKGDQYRITDKDDYPADNFCHWYELMSEKDESIILNAWNDEEHMVLDKKFQRVK